MLRVVGIQAGDGTWTPGSVLTNPTAGTVLVDSGPLAQGSYLVGLLGAWSAAGVYTLQHRDAANTATVRSQKRRPAAGNEDALWPTKIAVGEGERIRAVLESDLTGEVQLSLVRQEVP